MPRLPLEIGAAKSQRCYLPMFGKLLLNFGGILHNVIYLSFAKLYIGVIPNFESSGPRFSSQWSRAWAVHMLGIGYSGPQ